MADRANTLDITPEVLSLGDRIMAVRQVASVTGGRSRPLRWLGVVLMVVAIAMLAYESVLGGGLASIKSGGSTIIWLALITSGVGIFGQVYQRRQIVIAMSDGGRVRMNAARDDFSRQVIVRIGEAMRARPGDVLHYVVDLKAETIEIRAAAESVPVATAARQIMSMPHPAQQPGIPQLVPVLQQPVLQQPIQPHLQHATGPAAQPMRNDPAWQNTMTTGAAAGGGATLNGRLATLPHGQSGWPPQGPAPNGGQGPGAMGPGVIGPGAMGPGAAGQPPVHSPQQQPTNGAYGGNGMYNGSGAPGHRHSVTTGPPTAPPGQQRREIDAVIAFVMRSEIQHKQALLDLLNVVEDHVKGGQTSRDDALSNWQSFAGYVEQYLGNVDGLIGITHRAGRSLAQG